MRWSPEPPRIGETDGFSNETDIFGYSEVGGWLADLLSASEDDPVVLVDGDWGSGKTVFVRQWAGVLRRRGNAVLYFDAFASDHQEDAFLALTETVYGFADELGLKEPVRKAFSAAGARTGALALVKGLGRQLVPGLDVTAVVEEVREGVKDETSRLRMWIEEVRARKEAVSDFQIALREVARAAVEAAAEKAQSSAASSVGAESGLGDGGGSGRLIVIVDELDRCKPTFALGLLERIKHVFGVRGVSFVLVANLTELRQSVRRAYGDVGARRYLEKFYDLRLRLPEGGPNRRFRSKTDVYVRVLWAQLAPGRIRENRADRNALRRLADSEEMTLRTMEHVMRYVIVLATLAEGAFLGYPPTGVLMSALRVARPELFRRILRGEAKEGDAEVLAMKRVALSSERAGSSRPRSKSEEEPALREEWGLKQAGEVICSFDF